MVNDKVVALEQDSRIKVTQVLLLFLLLLSCRSCSHFAPVPAAASALSPVPDAASTPASDPAPTPAPAPALVLLLLLLLLLLSCCSCFRVAPTRV